MSITQISPASVIANPSQLNQFSQNVQNAALSQAAQAAQGAVAKSKSDTVTISAQALKKNSKSRSLKDGSKEETSEKAVTGDKKKG